MGYPLSAAGKAAFQSGAAQTLSIRVNTAAGVPFVLSESGILSGGFSLDSDVIGGNIALTSNNILKSADEATVLYENSILQGKFSIDRYVCNGSTLEIGSCVAAELNVELINNNGQFSNVIFEGAELIPLLSTEADGVTYSVPLGYFTVDSKPRMLKTIKLSALDRMMQFDRLFPATISFPITLADLVRSLCTECGVPLGTAPEDLANASYSVASAPSGDNLTCRQVLIWCCQLMGVCGWINWNGELALTWYENSGDVITPAQRFTSDIHEESVRITGVQLSTGDTKYLAGESGYVLNIGSNGLVQGDENELVNNIFNAIAITYNPFNATILPSPWMWPMDIISFEDASGVLFSTVITNWGFKLNQSTAISGIGETMTIGGYAAANPMTIREQAIIDSISASQSATVDAKVQSVLHFNELISNAIGLYFTAVPEGSGTQYYLHDASTLESSSTIFTVNSGGIAWTQSGWNDGDPVWQYGVTSAGGAFFDTVAANRVNADWIQVGKLQASDPEKFSLDLENGNLTLDALSVKVGGQDLGIIISNATSPISDEVDNLKSYIRINSDEGSMTFGSADNEITLKLVNDSLTIYNGSNAIDSFAANGTTTENLAIPQGGSLSMGNFKWTPRSSGSLDLMWVGG